MHKVLDKYIISTVAGLEPVVSAKTYGALADNRWFSGGYDRAVIEDDSKMFAGVDDTKERRVRNVLVGGEPLDPEKIYTLASHDYQLLNNGDGYTMYKGCKVLQESVKLDNQVLIDYITQTLGGVVSDGYENPYGQGRIVSVGAGE